MVEISNASIIYKPSCIADASVAFKNMHVNWYSQQMMVEQLDFFPMNRALSLAKEAEDETDTKLDELNGKVDLLVSKLKEQVFVTQHALETPFSDMCSVMHNACRTNVESNIT